MRELRVGASGVEEVCVGAEDGEAVPEHGCVAEECGSQVSCKSILAYSWVGARCE